MGDDRGITRVVSLRHIVPAALLCFATPAGAADYCGPEAPQEEYANAGFRADVMTFRVVDRGNSRILFAEGGYDSAAGDRFEAALNSVGRIDEVWLSSPGGSVAAGLKMGRVLKARGLAVRVPANHACISSCTLAFLGGAIRVVDENAYYGIHMFTAYSDSKTANARIAEAIAMVAAHKKRTGKDAPIEWGYQFILKDIEQVSAIIAAQLARYFIEMSASLDFLTGMAGQKNDGVCYVSRPGLLRYNVVNVE